MKIFLFLVQARDTVVELCLDNDTGTTPTEILINDWTQGSKKGYNSHQPSKIYHGPNQAQPLLAEHSNSSSASSTHANKRPATLTMSNEIEAIQMSSMDDRANKQSPAVSPTVDGNCTGVSMLFIVVYDWYAVNNSLDNYNMVLNIYLYEMSSLLYLLSYT